MNTKSEGETPIRVMIVDDHKSILWGLERLVESASPRMVVTGTAASCTEMLSVVVTARPDVILLDLDLDGQNSADFLPDLLRLTNAQVLILTGGRDFAFHQAALMKGARGVIGTDENADVLLLAIERVYAGEVWVNRMMMGKLLESMSASAGKGANADPEAAKIASLTPREREIVGAIVRSRGGKSLEIADSLHISEHTLRNHLTLIYEKLGVRNRLDLFAYAIEHGLDKDC